MTMDFNSLKRSSQSSLSALTKEISKINTPTTRPGEDARFWKPEVDKAKNGSATIRFLPAPAGEDMPFVRVWDHGFQGPTGKWYIENSLTTLGKADPVSELNTELWNSGIEANKDLVRKQKRRLTYIANIYVVKDPAHPENEGTVKLYKFGKKIFDKIKDVMQPQFEDEDPVNPFDFWKGANFKLKIRNVEGYRNYDKSEFDSATPLAEDDQMESIWKKQHSLAEFVDPKNFKSYDELKAKLTMVLSATGASAPRAEATSLDEDMPKPVAAKPAAKPKADFDNADDSLSYFAKLANDD